MRHEKKPRDDVRSPVLKKVVSRRAALSTAGKVAVGVIAAGVVAGVGGYLAGSAAAPTKTETSTVTSTKTVTASPSTVTKTVTVTQTAPTTVTTTPPVTTPKKETIRIPPGIEIPVKRPWSYKEAAKPYKGTTIRVIHDVTPASEATRELVEEFEDETGINVEWEGVTWGEVYAKVISDLEAGTGIYDVFYWEQDNSYAYIARGWCTDLTKLMQEHPELVNPDFDFDDFTTWINAFCDPRTGHLYGIPMEAFLKTYWYRADLYEELGVEPAKTWDEFIELSKKFYEWGKNRTPRLYGCGFQWDGVPLTYLFLEGFFPTHGVYCWGINLEKMRASVDKGGSLNSDKAVKAFEHFFELAELVPPDCPTYSWTDNFDAMAAGRTPHGPVEYSEGAAGAILKTPGLRLKCALPPTEPGVLDEVKARGPKGNVFKAYVSYYDGGAHAIPWCSKNKEAALLFIQWATDKERAYRIALKSTAPYRKSVIQRLMETDIEKITGYFSFMLENEWMFAPAPPFREHLYLVESIYDKWIHKIVAKEVGIKEGLDALAEEVDAFFEAMGY